jgi:hypothetical protein
LEEEVVQLRNENQALREQVVVLLEQLEAVRQQLTTALERIAELEQSSQEPPPFVKPHRPPRTEEKKPRRKRAAEYNRGRKRETPTRVVVHELERCRTCGYRLRGQSLARRRQVIDLPPPQPVEVVEHQVLKRWCPKCERWEVPSLDLQGQVLGQARIGVRIASLVAYLRTSLRLPIRSIRTYLHTLHGLQVSSGEVVELLHAVRRETQAAVEALKAQAQSSPVLHGDETGWRENGQNGYIWAFSTPGMEGVRYYEYDPSRGGAVVERILEKQFAGHLISDFYGGYNVYAGKHQRCWVHLLRDLHDLKRDQAADSEVIEWAQDVRQLYDDAHAFLQRDPPPSQQEREQQYVGLVERTQDLGLKYASATNKTHPCNALAKRLMRHYDELFQFVLLAGVPAHNNLAERSIRPLVVVRKISGGSRSPQGTKTRMALASLFGTWQARGLNPFEQCFQLLSRTLLPQV